MGTKFNPPKEFDFNTENWLEWISRWTRFRTISKLDKEEDSLQIESCYTLWDQEVKVSSQVRVSKQLKLGRM